ncbi:hypothetical protein [Marinomonas transparens]|uniref:Uncharacterized protein n=1 Tax=Marinomonas transparens TaxID=2795388 RepID=A0A934JI95_9GAMM|nr:hypothetical protein [Marinomonas transparens]MBJ7536535.1 hypothetical protein [Marinomonas transparens]
MTAQLDLLFDIAKEAARELAEEIAKEATKKALYDRDMAFTIAKDTYSTKMKREPTYDESNDLYELISDLCDEEIKRQKNHKIQQYMKLIQNIYSKIR